MLKGKEAVIFLIRRIDEKRETTPKNIPIRIDPAKDLNNQYSRLDLETLFKKLEADEKILKVTLEPDKDLSNCYHIKIIKPNFENYHNKLKLTKEYQDFTGNKPKRGYFDPKNIVDFNLTSKQNANRKLTIGQIEELNEFPKNKREKILKESLTPRHKEDIEKFSKTLTELFKRTKKLTPPILENHGLLKDFKLEFPPNQQAEQTKLLRQIDESLKNNQKPKSDLMKLKYDKKTKTIYLNGIKIPIDISGRSGNQSDICDLLFKNKTTIKDGVSNMEILERLGDYGVNKEYVKKHWKKVYNIVQGINKKVLQKVSAPNFILCRIYRTKINKSYL